MPPALPGEFAFAASGQCIVSQGGTRRLVRHRRRRRGTRLPLDDRGESWEVAHHAGPQRAERRHLRARVPRPAARPRRRRRLRLPTASPDAMAVSDDGGATGSPSTTRRASTARAPTGSPAHRDRGRAERQRRQLRPGPLLDALRRRQLRHGRLRGRLRVLGLGRAGPRGETLHRLEHGFALGGVPSSPRRRRSALKFEHAERALGVERPLAEIEQP